MQADFETINLLQIASKFAKLMDRNDYTGAGELMHPRCIYLFRGQQIQGRSAILEIYQSQLEAGAKDLDEIVFSSEIEKISDCLCKIKYLDRLRKKNDWFEHRCEQDIEIVKGLIVKITHIDLPGETERLQKWIKRNH